MKVIHIIPSLKIGGAERLAIEICSELNKNKSLKIVLISLSEVNDFKDESYDIEIKYIPSKISLSITGKTNVEISILTKFINEFKPDIIHTHLFEAELISRWNLYKEAVYFTHCHDNMSQLSGIRLNKSIKKNLTDYYEKRIILKKYLTCINKFIAISKNTQKYFEEVLPKKLHSNIHLLHNTIDYKKFENKKTKKSNKLKFINVGSFMPKKNQTFLIDIMIELKKRGVECELYLLGEGLEKNKVKEKVIKNGMENIIHFLGNVNEVEKHLWNSYLYLHSAYYEPFGLVLLEAMAAGLPVISLDGKGNKDFIENGVNGYIIKNQNPKDFSDIIINVIKDVKLYKKLSENGQKTAKRFDIKNYSFKLLQIYKESISSAKFL